MPHLHRYKRVNLGRKKFDKVTKTWSKNDYFVYKCTKLGCNHYKIPALIKDSLGECPICGDSFILTRKSLLLTNPHCDNCTKTKKEFEPGMELLEELGIGDDEG